MQLEAITERMPQSDVNIFASLSSETVNMLQTSRGSTKVAARSQVSLC